MLKIIVGLGNPGEKFKNTRHNIGFLVVDKITQILNVPPSPRLRRAGKCQNYLSALSSRSKDNLKLKTNKKFQAEILQLTTDNQQLLLVKPQTFMNSSGIAVKKIISYYYKSPNHLITPAFAKATAGRQLLNHLYIVHDDLDIPLGEYKIQFGRRAAGHHGVESVINNLGTKNFWRVRVGIGNEFKGLKVQKFKGEDMVLQKFRKEEKEIIDKVINKTIDKLTDSKF